MSIVLALSPGLHTEQSGIQALETWRISITFTTRRIVFVEFLAMLFGKNSCCKLDEQQYSNKRVHLLKKMYIIFTDH
jgi:hypothetical protein